MIILPAFESSFLLSFFTSIMYSLKTGSKVMEPIREVFLSCFLVPYPCKNYRYFWEEEGRKHHHSGLRIQITKSRVKLKPHVCSVDKCSTYEFPFMFSLLVYFNRSISYELISLFVRDILN
jgi:hypothetical protein